MRSEFSIIRQYFDVPATHAEEICLGIGDDAALLCLPSGAGFASAQADRTGRDLSEHPAASAAQMLQQAVAKLTAAGAHPVSFTLCLSLPADDPRWLRRFSASLHDEAERLGLSLIGGDTTRGAWLAIVHCHGVN